jgi:N6-adenosine-specific RNA methylase IME4
MFPEVARLEMFARYDDKLFRPEGWDFWGNEAKSDTP